MRNIIIVTALSVLFWGLAAAHLCLWSYTRNISLEMDMATKSFEEKLKKQEEAMAEAEKHRQAKFAEIFEQYIQNLSDRISAEDSWTIPSANSWKSYPDIDGYIDTLIGKIFEQYVRELSERIAQDSKSNQQEPLTDAQIAERYIQESEKLMKVNRLIHDHINSLPSQNDRNITHIQWYRWFLKYEQPLLEAAKLAMKRVTGTEDYLEIWEKRIPEKIDGDISIFSRGSKIAPTTGYSNYEEFSLYKLYTIAIVYERQSELLSGMFYGDYADDSYGSSSAVGRISDTKKYVLRPVICSKFSLLGVTWNPYRRTVSFWEIIAIYSFKNDRARDLLFDLVTRPRNDNNLLLVNDAVYFLTLLPNSEELLPKVKALLQENITEALLRDEPADWSRHILDANGKLHDPSIRSLCNTLVLREREMRRDWHSYRKKFDIFFAIVRLRCLERALEFNEKIPAEERERFDFIRRDRIIADSESGKLQEGEEHFEIYLQEYLSPYTYSSGPSFDWASDDFFNSSPKTLENPFWKKRKEFYERELANPRPIYTENQIECLKTWLKNLERSLK